MRLFGGERIQNMMEALKIDENQPIETKMLTNSIESAQKKVEGRNFAIRRNVLQFDDVMNRQREIIYSQRAKVLDGENLRSYIMDMLKDSITETVNQYLSDEVIHDNWNVDGLRNHYLGFFTTPEDFHYTPDELANMEKKDFVDALYEKAVAKYEEKEQEIGVERMREVERVVLLRNVDTKWMDHIDAMDELKKGIYLRSYGQRDPVVEYRIEGFDMFDAMVAAIREDTVKMLLTVRLRNPNEELRREQVANPTSESHGDEGGRVQTQAVRVRSPRKP